MRIGFHPQASAELITAAQFYENQVGGLGFRFLIAVDQAIEALQADPLRPAPDAKARRKWRVKRFPYHFIYKIGNNQIFILAVAHASRKPAYWSKRTD